MLLPQLQNKNAANQIFTCGSLEVQQPIKAQESTARQPLWFYSSLVVNVSHLRSELKAYGWIYCPPDILLRLCVHQSDYTVFYYL